MRNLEFNANTQSFLKLQWSDKCHRQFFKIFYFVGTMRFIIAETAFLKPPGDFPKNCHVHFFCDVSWVPSCVTPHSLTFFLYAKHKISKSCFRSKIFMAEKNTQNHKTTTLKTSTTQHQSTVPTPQLHHTIEPIQYDLNTKARTLHTTATQHLPQNKHHPAHYRVVLHCTPHIITNASNTHMYTHHKHRSETTSHTTHHNTYFTNNTPNQTRTHPHNITHHNSNPNTHRTAQHTPRTNYPYDRFYSSNICNVNL